MSDYSAGFKSSVLENGITLYVNHIPDKTFEVFSFLVHSGAEKDQIGLEGTAHFVEHVISRNSSTSRKEKELFFSDCGGGADFGSTGYLFTRYRFFLPINKSSIIKGLSIFADMLLSADIKEIDIQRKVIVEEFNRKYKVSFEFNLDLKRNKILYPGIWLGRFASPFGDLDSIPKIQKDDLQNFYNEHYNPKNISIFCAGGMTIKEVEEVIKETSFSKNKDGEKGVIDNPELVFKALSENRYIFNFSEYYSKNDVIKAARYYMYVKIPNSFSSNPIVFTILKRIFNEVLYDKIREERGWTYSINAQFENYKHFITFYISCNNLNISALDEIEDAIDECINMIKSDSELFNRIKKQTIAKSFINDDTVFDIVGNAMDFIIFAGRIISNEDKRKLIESVTMENIIDLLEYFKSEYRWTLIMKP